MIPWLMKWEKSITIILKSRGMCFERPSAIKSKQTKPRKPQRNEQKPHKNNQPTNQLLYYLRRAPTFEYLGAPFVPSPRNAVTGALHRALCQKMECPVWELATSVRKLLQMVQLISCQTPSKHHPRVWGPHLD